MIIQTILLDPSGAVWTDEASNVSRLDPSGATWADAEHPTRNRKVVGSMMSQLAERRGSRLGRRHPCCLLASFHGGLVQQLGGCGSSVVPVAAGTIIANPRRLEADETPGRPHGR
jgi:hypothetical protein